MFSDSQGFLHMPMRQYSTCSLFEAFLRVLWEKNINYGIPIDPMPNSPNKHDENYLADSKENW